MTHFGDQARIDEEASSWLILLDERPLSGSEQQAFDAWRAQSPRHERAYEELRRTWGELPALGHLGDLAPVKPLAESPVSSMRRWPRRRVIAAALTATAALALLLLPAILGDPSSEFRTEIAQTRLLTLPDGSQVTLGARSTLDVRFSQSERRVWLAGGQAFFEVTHEANRPFLVEAGPSLIRVVGTRFDVNRGAQSVRVSVLDGVVQIGRQASSNAVSAPELLLRAGERAEIPISGDGSTVPAQAQPARATGSWREGRLVYEDVRLADVAADVNRYYEPGVTLTGDAGELRVTAAFKASEIPAFLAALPDVVPVEVAETSDRAFRVSSPRR